MKYCFFILLFFISLSKGYSQKKSTNTDSLKLSNFLKGLNKNKITKDNISLNGKPKYKTITITYTSDKIILVPAKNDQ